MRNWNLVLCIPNSNDCLIFYVYHNVNLNVTANIIQTHQDHFCQLLENSTVECCVSEYWGCESVTIYCCVVLLEMAHCCNMRSFTEDVLKVRCRKPRLHIGQGLPDLDIYPHIPSPSPIPCIIHYIFSLNYFGASIKVLGCFVLTNCGPCWDRDFAHFFSCSLLKHSNHFCRRLTPKLGTSHPWPF